MDMPETDFPGPGPGSGEAENGPECFCRKPAGFSCREVFKRHGFTDQPFIPAAPSFVIPGTVRENCAWLRNSFPEVGLMLYETKACLAYGQDDLPDPRKVRGPRFHAHLPLDLDWERGLDAVLSDIESLLAAVGPLKPHCLVLHPPADPALLPPLARGFARLGFPARRVLLENVEDRSLIDIWPHIQSCGYGLCLDLGHLLLYGQMALLGLPGVFARTHMLHLSATDARGRHLSLARLDEKGLAALDRLLAGIEPGCVVLIEVFDPEGLRESLEITVRRAALVRKQA